MKMGAPFKLRPVIIWAKISPKCLVSNFKMKRRKRSLYGKPVGVSPPDRSASWLCNMAMTKVSFSPQEPLKFKPLSSQFHSRANKSWSIKLAKNLRQP
jgi:hypothetical protein